jgi:hypothetical protein
MSLTDVSQDDSGLSRRTEHIPNWAIAMPNYKTDGMSTKYLGGRSEKLTHDKACNQIISPGD